MIYLFEFDEKENVRHLKIIFGTTENLPNNYGRDFEILSNKSARIHNMKNIDPQTPIWQLTVEQFLQVSKNIGSEKKYEYGLKGLAKILGCSVSKASEVKSSGILDKAIIQNGNIIIIDKEKALELFGKK